MKTATFPAGTYYIGDPCYVFEYESWQEFGDANNWFLEGGEYEFRGHRIFTDSTAHGDGVYRDQYGRRYGVDAGMLGIIPIDLVIDEGVYGERSLEASSVIHAVTFDEPFEVRASGRPRSRDEESGYFQFGPIVIHTDDQDEEDYDEYEEEDEYEYEYEYEYEEEEEAEAD